ncbi:MAG TPA: hypothetical protein P5272_01470 [Caldisericia bacterium]|nr:hypothetical protein [Caldisericia bacterium]HPC56683.1 hypothetical protein [Caldisericia bacterium]HRT36834.1 hypothetical protein [Caldisericia bacterium]HRU73634.1 hypothetical protein [Caldisericia bacterium]
MKFIKIYYVQLIIFLSLFLILMIFFKLKLFTSFLLIFLISLFYFYIYPNFIQKNLINYSETFFVEEKENVNEINLDISLSSGNLKIDSDTDEEKLIFDYNSKYKIFISSKIKNDILNYQIFENPVFNRTDLSDSEWSLKINKDIITNLNINTDCINGFFDLKNLKIGKLNFIAKSSRVELYLPETEGTSFFNLKFEPSIIDIYIPENFYIEVESKLNQSVTNILEVGFKEKEKNIYYLDGGDKGKIYIKISGKNLNIRFNFIQD